ncbi:MAG: GNAT family N-acetyltransferase [Cyanobacteria bacterium J06638_22]
MMVLETERLLLREMGLQNIDALLATFADAEAMRFYPKPFDREMMKAWVEWNMQGYADRGFGLWAIVLKKNGEVIGDCGLVVQQIEGVDEVEIGYHVRRDLWGQGFATEAAQACREYGFHQLGRDRLISLIHPENLASRRVAEKNGMVLVKEFTWRDKPTCLYAIERNPNE